MASEGGGSFEDREGGRTGITRREAVVGLAAAAAWPWVGGPLRAVTREAGRGRRPTRRAALPPRTVGLRSLGGDFRFDPPGLLVSRGDVVTWLNMGDFHTASAFHPANDGLLARPVPRRVPEGAESFHSGMLGLDAGSVFEHAFGTEGVHDYFCQPHYSFGMVGRVVVEGPRGGPAVTGDDSALVEAAREALPAVEAITGPPGRGFEWASRINGVLLVRTRDGKAGAAAEAVLEAARADGDLAAALAERDAEGAFFDRLESFVDAVAGGDGYESLVDRADRAKEPLASLATRSS